MGAVRYTSAAFVVLLSAIIYTRWSILPTFYFNAPSRLPTVNNVGKFNLAFRDTVRNCEDAYLNEKEGWALLSCDPGRDVWNTVLGVFNDPRAPPETNVYLYKYGDGLETKPVPLKWNPAKENRNDFHPLGIEYHEQSKTLYVVHHALKRSRVDWFKLDVETGVASFAGTTGEDPQVLTPNSVAAISSTSFFATNDHQFDARTNPYLSKFEMYAGFPGGSVVYVRHPSQDKKLLVKTLAKVPFANGITFLNVTTLAVASVTTGSVRLFDISIDSSDDTPVLTPTATISLPFLPDNLSVDSKGKLLIAGHPHVPSVEVISLENAKCQDPVAANTEACKLPMLSWVAEWSEQEGVKTLYSGSEYGTSTTAVRDHARGFAFVVGLYERGIMSWKF